MVRIENIKVNDKDVSFEYYPESKSIRHFLKYNKETKEIIEHLKSKEFTTDVYAKHAYRYVKKIVEQRQEIPPYYVVAWY